jgi:hypothetical protein
VAHYLSGPLLYRIPDDRNRRADVQVLWCTPPWAAPVIAPSALDRKRTCYWRAGPRNDFLANLAEGLRQGQQELLWELGLFLSEQQSASSMDLAGRRSPSSWSQPSTAGSSFGDCRTGS